MTTQNRFRVQLVGSGKMAKTVVIEATNPPEAKEFAEARYPGYEACSANMIH